MPHATIAQHQGTVAVMTTVPLSKVEWSVLCVSIMTPISLKIEVLAAPRNHELILKAAEPPGWRDSWVKSLPVVGNFLNIAVALPGYTTRLEAVADFLAEDLEKGSGEWVGKLVGMKQREKGE
jgi:hypothetical protein